MMLVSNSFITFRFLVIPDTLLDLLSLIACYCRRRAQVRPLSIKSLPSSINCPLIRAVTAILNCQSLVKVSVFLDALITKSVYQPLSVNCEAILNELLDEGRSEYKFAWRVNS